MRKITSRIKIMGLMLSAILISLIAITIYLNEQTKHDSYVVNIAGKERMLSQKMAKELFLNISQYKSDFREFSTAKDEFTSNLNALKNGNSYAMITPPPSEDIKNNLNKISELSENFFHHSELIRATILTGNTVAKQQTDDIYTLNNKLLQMIDNTVKDYTTLSADKKRGLEIVQYFFGMLTMIAIFFTLYLTKQIDQEFDHFLASANEVSKIRCEENSDEDIKIANEVDSNELLMAEANMKNFLKKVEKVIQKAQSALNESYNALSQIEGAAKIMEQHTKTMSLDESHKKEIGKYIDKSEDLTINSLDEIANTKQMLDKFQNTIDTIVKKMR